MPEVISEAAKQAALEINRTNAYPIGLELAQRIIQAAIDQACAAQSASTAEDVQDMMKDGEHIAGLVEELRVAKDNLQALKRILDKQLQKPVEYDRLAEARIIELSEELRQTTGKLRDTEMCHTIALAIVEDRDKTIAALTRDKERLDWLEQWAEASLIKSDEGIWQLEVCCPATSEDAPTVREAIDAAGKGER